MNKMLGSGNKFYKFLRKNVKRQYSMSFDKIPGPYAVPGIGTIYQYLPGIGNYNFNEMHHNGSKKLKSFGRLIKEEIVPGTNIVWLFNPRDIKAMFRYDGKYPQQQSHLALEKYRLDRPNMYHSGGLLPTNGPEWFRIRSALQKGLSSPQSVQNFLNPTDDIVQEWMSNLTNVVNENEDFLPEISRLNSFSKEERKYWSRSSKLMKAALMTNSLILKTDNGPRMWKKIDTPLYRKLKKSQKYIENVAIDILSLKMSIFNGRDRNKPLTLLESYLASPELDFKDILGMACDFLLAGIDTTSYTASFKA